MKRLAFFLTAVGIFSAASAQVTSPVNTSPDATGEIGEYIRFESDSEKGDRLQTAISRFQKGETLVDLVSVVHLGDKAYFEYLNRYLAPYDAVLYELVGGKYNPDAAREAAVDEMAGVRMLQQMAKSFLGLEFQLDGIDYESPNFVHADVDWDEYNELMLAKNQTFATLFTRAMSLAESGEISGFAMDEAEATALFGRMLGAITSGDSNELKRSLAPLLSEAEGFITQLEGEDGTVLVSERNKVVLSKLEELRAGQAAAQYAIFYGAGHMPDLERRLLLDGYRKTGEAWVDAWSIPAGAGGATSGPESSVPGTSLTAPTGSSADLLINLIEANPELVETFQDLSKMLEQLNSALAE